MSKVFWRAATACAVVCASAIGACSSSDSSTPEPSGGAGGGTGGASTGGTGGASTGGTAGASTGGTSGEAGTGGSGTAGTGGTGGSSSDSDCDETATEVECSACCASHHPVGGQFLKDAQQTCVCESCAVECATSICATPPSSPDDACKACAGPCNSAALTECATDTDCAAMMECGKTYCVDKP